MNINKTTISIGAGVAFLAVIVPLIVAVASSYSTVQAQVNQNTKQIDSLSRKIDLLNQNLVVTNNNVVQLNTTIKDKLE